jgi:hydroxyacylglutathione hydrolase
MLEKTIVVGPFQCNCRIWVCPRTGECVVVDPGDESARILKELQNIRTPAGNPLKVKYLLHTHGHLDHIGAAGPLLKALGPSSSAEPQSRPIIALHRGDEPLYLNLKNQGQLFGLEYEEPLPIDHFLEDGEELRVGDLKFSILHTPGHSPGSVCIRLHQDTALGIPEAVLSGDTLFQSSVGRTDLWGANQDVMFKSIFDRILKLDDDTRVCPGHGGDTRIGIEKKSNPFLQ